MLQAFSKSALWRLFALSLLIPSFAGAHPDDSRSAEGAPSRTTERPSTVPDPSSIDEEGLPKAGFNDPGIALPWPAPLEQIRVHIVWTANDDGADPSPMSLSKFSALLPRLNEIYDDVGIQFVFDPATDFETVLDTRLNKTFLLLDDPANYPNPAIAPPVERASFTAARRALADRYRGKLVIFLANPDRLYYDNDLSSWAIRAENISASSHNERYVSMVAERRASSFAHEIGHFLHLTHPFSSFPTVAAAEAQIASKLAQGLLSVADGLRALDGDYPYVTDTPADAGTSIWIDHFGVNQGCIGDDSTSIPLNVPLPWGGFQAYDLQPNRRLAVGYFYCSPLAFSPQQILRVHDAIDTLNRHDLLSEPPTSATRLQRRGSAYAGAITDVEAVRVGRGYIATATLASNGMMKVVPWAVSKSGAISRAGAGAYAGPVSEIATTGMGLGQLVTAVRNGSGLLQLITWKAHEDGTVERLSSVVDVPIKKVKIARFDMLNVVTAVQLPNNSLKVIAWQLNADGTIERLAEADAGEVDGFDISPSWLGVMTPVRDSSGNLRVTNWQVRSVGTWKITRKGTADFAPTSPIIAATGMDTPSHGAIAHTDAFDWLKISTWSGDYDGTITPGDVDYAGAKCTEIASKRLGTEVLAVGCRVAGNSNLLMTLFDIDPGGQGIRLLDFQFIGSISALSFARAQEDVVVSAVRNGSGNLQLIAWKRTEDS